MDVFAVVERSGHAALAIDESGRILTCNRAFTRLLGMRAGRAVGRVLREIVDARDVFGNRAYLGDRTIHDMVAGGQPVHSFELDLRAPSGGSMRLVVSVLPVIGPEPGDHRLIFYLTPRKHRREADEALDLLLKTGVPSDLLVAESQRWAGAASTPLTRRELEVLRHFAGAGGTREVAGALGVSVNTLRTHTARILRKLRARTRAEAVAKAYRQGLL
jgi:PAS domain S-box-containing protein